MSEVAIKVGGECESYCTTCRIMKDHVIVAMVAGRPAKVECAGCHKQHAYRPGAPGTAPATKDKKERATKPRMRTITPPPQLVADLEAKLARSEATARPYSPKTQFAINEVLRHPTFGVGLVVALPGANKMEVDFRGGGRKLLVHGKAA